MVVFLHNEDFNFCIKQLEVLATCLTVPILP